MGMSNVLRWLKRGSLIIVGLAALLTVVSILIARNSEPEPVTYSFNKTGIKFPISVGEAIKRYKTLPHQYPHTEADLVRPTACQLKKSSNGVSEIFYVDRADDFIKAPADSLDREVYAVRFCYSKQNKQSLTELMSQLEKEFGRPFELKVTSGRNESYYELDLSWHSSIVIDFCPADKYKPDAVRSGNFKEWTVNFCYGIKYSTIGCFVDYEVTYDAQ
jgi:hypothetical protein